MDILSGTNGDLIIIDVKHQNGNFSDYWSLFKGNNDRTGEYIASGGNNWDCGSPESGDINCDAIINILDIISVLNMVIDGFDGFTEYELWSADVNQDNIINILDIVAIVNIVIEE